MDQTDDVSKTLALGASTGRGWFKKWVFIGLVLLAGVGLFFKWNTGRNGASVQYTTQSAVMGSLTVTVTATGNLEPINQVDVGSELSGIVRTVEADYNDSVVKDQVLARLDTSKLEAVTLQSRAALDAAKARVLQAQATIRESSVKLDRLKRLSKLSDSRAVSQLDLDVADASLARAKADESSAKAEVERAKAILDANETDLSKAVIRSPINGIVLARSVEPGQTVAASLQAPVLFTLAEDLARMELRVDVDEADVGQVHEGQKATFTVDAYPERSFPAVITQVRFGSKTVEGVVTYETLLNVDNADLSLRPGMTATADIVVREIEDTLLVPNAALRFSPPENSKAPRQQGGILTKLFPRPSSSSNRQREDATAGKKQQKVWTLRDGQPVLIPVSIGMSDGTRTQITDGGLRPDTPLIVDAVSSRK